MDPNSSTDKEGSVFENEPPNDENLAVDDVEQLIQSRRAALEQKQIARKAAWREEARKEIDQRTQYRLQMEDKGIPRSHITSWKEQLTLYQVSQQWRKRFRQAKTQLGFLSPAVFSILSEHQIKTDTGTEWLLPVEHILDFRGNSKALKDAIDDSLSATRYHELSSGLDAPTLRKRPPQRVLRPIFYSLEDIKTFQKEVRRYRGMNPFPTRHFYIGAPLGSLSLGMAYWVEMEELLKRWGDQIWSAIYVFDDGSIEMMYEFLIKYLKAMPNLQELVIMERDRSGTHEGHDVIPLLKSRIERNPLPELPQLHTLFLVDLTPVPLIAAALEKYGGALKYFMLHVPDAFSGDFSELEPFVSGNPLTLQKYSCRFTDSPRIPLWNLQFPEMTQLELTYFNVGEGAEVENVFKTVNSCGSSLRQLSLAVIFDVPDTINEDQWRDRLPIWMKLELPHLEMLELTVEWSKVTNMDLLLPLASLKELTFSYYTSNWDEREMDDDGIIQFVGYMDRMYDSNIWAILPEINLLTICSIPIENPSKEHLTTNVYTRDGYRQYQRDQDQDTI